MTVKFYNYNLVDQPSTVITASSENAFFPVSNLKDDRRTKVFRSTAASCTLVFDFITAESVDSILLVPHITYGWGFNSSTIVEANTTNTWGSPAFSTTIGPSEIDQEHMVAVKEFTAQTYRFWRLTFTGTSYVEISKLFIGAKQLIGTGKSIDYNWQYVSADNSIIQLNRYGQKFIDVLPEQKRIAFSISNMTITQVDSFFAIYDYSKKTKPFFFYIDCVILNNNKRLLGYFYFDEKPALTNPFHALWSTQATLSEAM